MGVVIRSPRTWLTPAACFAALALSGAALAEAVPLDGAMHHLRSGTAREWADFPAEAEGPSLTVRFRSTANTAERALRLRQQDVKQPWRVLLNGKELVRLTTDDDNSDAIRLYVRLGFKQEAAGRDYSRLTDSKAIERMRKQGEGIVIRFGVWR